MNTKKVNPYIPYMGNKNSIRKFIVDRIEEYFDRLRVPQNKRVVIDGMCGGGSIAFECARRDMKVYANDSCTKLIGLHKYLQNLNDANLLWSGFVTREDFLKYRNEDTPYGAYVSYIWSFGNTGLSYMFGLDNDIEALHRRREPIQRREHLVSYVNSPLKNKIIFSNNDYRDLTQLAKKLVEKGDFVIFYMDPPYNNTHGYNKQKFDSEQFYNWVRRIRYPVFFSEFTAPDDFYLIDEKLRPNKVGGKLNEFVVTERLYCNQLTLQLTDNGVPYDYRSNKST